MSMKRVWVAGHRGMVGSAVAHKLRTLDHEVLTVDRDTVDLRRQEPVERWLAQNRPDLIIVAAAKVGGIWANDTYPVDFLYENLAERGECHSRRAPSAGRSVGVSRFILHSSPAL